MAPPVIIPYRGYGTPTRIFLKGHVLDDRLLYESHHKDKRKKNILSMISRYISTGLPDLRVEISFDQVEKIVTTDNDGHFDATLDFEKPVAPGWYAVKYQVLDKILENQEPLEEYGEVYIEDGQSEFGIISDIDDTILISHATRVLKKLRLILTKNSKTRLPFMGVASFYKALHLGRSTYGANPLYYVSSSEWNLYDFLEDFFDVRSLPKGPFLLQDLKTSLWKLIKSGGGNHNHKKEKIEQLFKLFPKQQFILIGDSGQHDASLYRSLAEEYPDQVLAIYIRDVGKEKHANKVNKIAANIKGDVEMLLVSDSFEAALHAYQHGFITIESLQEVEREFEQQKGKPKTLVGQVLEKDTNS